MKGTHAGKVHSKIQTSNFIVQLFDQHIKPTNHKETQIREVTLLDLVEQSLDEATVKLWELKQRKQAGGGGFNAAQQLPKQKYRFLMLGYQANRIWSNLISSEPHQ